MTPSYLLHAYYTPKFIQIQVKITIFAIFVNYAYIYVNIIMSTKVKYL